MIKLTKLGGGDIVVNVMNIQWIEEIPDVSITVLGGARILVREKLPEVLQLIEQYYASHQATALPSTGQECSP
jgi:flagellar protein FlbD